MTRQPFFEIIKGDDLEDNITRMGERTIAGLRTIARDTGAFGNVRGIGSLLAFTFEDGESRHRMIESLYERKVLALPSGFQSVRFRLPLIISEAEVDELLARVAASVPAVGSKA